MPPAPWFPRVTFLLLFFLMPMMLMGYRSGPPARRTGAPGDGTCLSSGCHTGTLFPANSSAITLTFPNGLTYTPGVTQHITLKVTDSAAQDYGFELSSRLASDTTNGQAGNLIASDTQHPTLVVCEDDSVRGRAGCSSDAPLQFLEHTAFVTPVNPSGTWSFDWTPPATDVGDVIFYVASNASPTVQDIETGNKHVHLANFRLKAAAASSPAPVITSGGVLNNASGTDGFTQNSYVSIYGTNLSTTSPGRAWAAADLVNGLPASLDGTSVTINGKSAFVEYISPTQINVIAPLDSSTGPVPVQVSVNGQTSNTVLATLQTVAPAFFTFDGKHLAATHADGSFVGPVGLFPGTPANFTTPAHPGETIILYGNAFGDTTPGAPAGQPTQQYSPLVTAPVVMVGGSKASVAAGLIAPYAALYQLNVTLPANAPSGDQQIFAIAAGVTSPDSAACCFITVQ